MTLTARVLAALGAGLVLGIGLSLFGNPGLLAAAAAVEPIGALWVNAIRMTVIPLVVSLLVTGIVSDGGSSIGSVGGRALGLFVVFIIGGAVFTALAAPPLLSLADFDTQAFASLRESVAIAEVELPPFGDWFAELIPSNPIRSAADGAMLQVVVFAVILAMAIARMEGTHKQALSDFFAAVAAAMLTIVGWVLRVAPVGVFFLVLPLAASSGIELAGAFGYYWLVACGLVSAALLALYPVAVIFGGVTLSDFARASAPAQAVGFSTRSSLASLPAMLDAGENALGLPTAVNGVVLPGAVALFKYATPVARMTGTFFIAQLYGIDLGLVEIVAITVSLAALSFYSPGVPSGALFVLTPVYVALGLPVEGIGLLIALDLVPDMFLTAANVTADLTVAVVLGKRSAPSALDLDEARSGEGADLTTPNA